METFQQLVVTLGVPGALLIIALIYVWREWRKAEAKVISLLEEQHKEDVAAIVRYSSFENVLKQLAQILE